jgi:elongin-B
MYVRVKRQKITLFIQVEPSDKISDIKSEIESLIKKQPDQQRLFKDGIPLEIDQTLAELKIENDDIIALSLFIDDNGGWDDPAIVNPEEETEDEV